MTKVSFATTNPHQSYAPAPVDDLWDTNAEADVEVDDESQKLMYVGKETANSTCDCCCLLGWFLLSFLCQFLSIALNSNVLFDTYEEIYDANYMASTPVEIYGPIMLMVSFFCSVAVWLVWMEGGCIRQRVNIFSFLLHLVMVSLLPDLFFASTYTFTSSSWTATASQLRTVSLFLAFLLLFLDFALMISFWKVNLFAGMTMLPQVGWMFYVVGFIAVSIDNLDIEWWIHALLILASVFVLFTLCMVCSVMLCSKCFYKRKLEE